MSASGFTPIQLFRTTTAAAVPTAGSLAAGELAINLTDEALYFKNAAGVVKLLASNSGSLGSVTSVAASGGTTGLTFSGSPITTSGTLTLGGTLAVANGGTGVTTSTGSVSVVLSKSPTLETPILGAATATSIANGLGAVGTPSYTFTGDTNTGMWSPAADTIAFSEGGVEAMRIDSSANVGIGTSSPGARLDARAANITDGTNGGIVNVYSTTAQAANVGGKLDFGGLYDGSNSLSFASVAGRKENSTSGDWSGYMQFSTRRFGGDFAERMRIDGSGNLILGTTVGAARFRVSAAANVNAPVLGNVTNYPAFFSNTDPGYGLGIGTSAADGRVWLQAQRSDSATAFNLTLNEAGGNVGIGTSSPQQTAAGRTVLGVNGTSSSLINIGSGGNFGSYWFWDGSTATLAANNSLSLLAGASPILFNNSGVERARIDASGNLLVGSSAAPAGSGTNLQIASASAARLWLTATGNRNFYFESSGGNALQIVDATAGAERARIDANGNVGINTASPAARLDVNGNTAQNIVAVAALDVDCTLGNFFTKTIAANSTFTFSNAPASRAFAFTLEIVHTSGTITWPAAVRWPGNTAPTLTTGRTHLITFVTDNAGTTWYGAPQTNYLV